MESPYTTAWKIVENLAKDNEIFKGNIYESTKKNITTLWKSIESKEKNMHSDLTIRHLLVGNSGLNLLLTTRQVHQIKYGINKNRTTIEHTLGYLESRDAVIKIYMKDITSRIIPTLKLMPNQTRPKYKLKNFDNLLNEFEYYKNILLVEIKHCKAVLNISETILDMQNESKCPSWTIAITTIALICLCHWTITNFDFPMNLIRIVLTFMILFFNHNRILTFFERLNQDEDVPNQRRLDKLQRNFKRHAKAMIDMAEE